MDVDFCLMDDTSTKVCWSPQNQLHLIQLYQSYRPNIADLIKKVEEGETNITQIDTSLHSQLHILWIGFFYELFGPLYEKTGSLFYLMPVDELEIAQMKDIMWTQFITAKARFDCPNCGHIWTSVKSGVQFFLKKSQFQSNNSLGLYFYLIPQYCTECKNKAPVFASWYPHEVIRVLLKIKKQICKKFWASTYAQSTENALVSNKHHSINFYPFNCISLSQTNVVNHGFVLNPQTLFSHDQNYYYYYYYVPTNMATNRFNLDENDCQSSVVSVLEELPNVGKMNKFEINDVCSHSDDSIITNIDEDSDSESLKHYNASFHCKSLKLDNHDNTAKCHLNLIPHLIQTEINIEKLDLVETNCAKKFVCKLVPLEPAKRID